MFIKFYLIENNFFQVCDGINDCQNFLDEENCPTFEYNVRLSNNNNNSHEGCLEIGTEGGIWRHICDNKFTLDKAGVICKKLGFDYGASEIKLCSNNYEKKSNIGLRINNFSYKGNDFNSDFISKFNSYECSSEDAIALVCYVPKMRCLRDYWLCENTEECIPISFLCDDTPDCSDGADENSIICTSPIEYRLIGRNSIDIIDEGRAEIRYKGIWGTICDDNFGNAEATVFCRALGFNGTATVSKLKFI